MGFKVTEVPVNHRARTVGVSKYGFGNRALKATMDMCGARWLNLSFTHICGTLLWRDGERSRAAAR